MYKLQFYISMILIITEANLISQDDKNQIYLIKYDWHVGIVFEIDSTDSNQLKFISKKDSGKIIDIGWGDEDFYQNEAEDILLGAKAILWPTSSVIRIGKYSYKLSSMIRHSDFTVKIDLSRKQFAALSEFINSSFEKDETGELILVSSRMNNSIMFFKSVYNYHLFNTCNTWIADALEYSGVKIDAGGVITAEALYDEIIKIGTIVKMRE